MPVDMGQSYESCFTAPAPPSGLCVNCGIPLDSQAFDRSIIANLPDVGEQIVLASFELPAQYCGVLEHVAQFTDLNARRADQVETPGLVWNLFANGRAVDPFNGLSHILNPWGFGSYKTRIRLDDGARLELVLRRTAARTALRPGLKVQQVGGRLVGWYWYNRAFGEVSRTWR